MRRLLIRRPSPLETRLVALAERVGSGSNVMHRHHEILTLLSATMLIMLMRSHRDDCREHRFGLAE